MRECVPSTQPTHRCAIQAGAPPQFQTANAQTDKQRQPHPMPKHPNAQTTKHGQPHPSTNKQCPNNQAWTTTAKHGQLQPKHCGVPRRHPRPTLQRACRRARRAAHLRSSTARKALRANGGEGTTRWMPRKDIIKRVRGQKKSSPQPANTTTPPPPPPPRTPHG